MTQLPQIFRVRQKFVGPTVDDVAAEVAKQLAGLALDKKIAPGSSVAITAGSRGIANIPVILKAASDYLRGIGAQPFLIPTMGSHGGGTAEGQRGVLASLGVTEETVGCPIRASMDTVVLTDAPQGFPIHFDRVASEADHVLVCGRVKPHTGFNGKYQSGLLKMLLLGLGKHEGAKAYHRAFVTIGFDEVAERVVPSVLDRGKIVGGLAILENGYCRTAQITAVPQEEFLTRDPELLSLAQSWMAKLPFDLADVLVVDEIGKHISGTGMDTNIIGRKRYDHCAADEESPEIRRIVVRSVKGGNACGIGMSEFCHARVVEQADMEMTWINALTSLHPTAGMLPVSYPTDRETIETALRTIGMTEPQDAKLMWIKNTSKLETLACSEAYLDEARQHRDLEILDEPQPMAFDDEGNLVVD
jgi:hypothetical protein